jgi:transcriptional regulator with XRE-family HTH domain
MNAAAKAVGVAQPTIRRIVEGEVGNPRADVLLGICRFYGASMDWLAVGVGEAPQVDRLKQLHSMSSSQLIEIIRRLEQATQPPEPSKSLRATRGAAKRAAEATSEDNVRAILVERWSAVRRALLAGAMTYLEIMAATGLTQQHLQSVREHAKGFPARRKPFKYGAADRHYDRVIRRYWRIRHGIAQRHFSEITGRGRV